MPLSPEEQRILQEIERSFYENDPAFATQVKQTTIYRHAGRNLKLAALGFIAGLVILVVFFASYVFVGFAGFLLMLGSAFSFERNLRRVGKAGLQQIRSSVKAGGLSDALGNTRRKMKDRFRTEE